MEPDETACWPSSKFVDTTSETTLKAFRFTSLQAPNHYEYLINGGSVRLDLKPGQTTTINLKRIDVNDVLLDDTVPAT